jgi:cation transport regulator ChaC
VAADVLWYFGYGSNMSRATFVERRGMRPSAAQPARLHGYRLCFDIPVGPGERGVANVVREPEAVVWGVVYAITGEEFERLDRTEGVPFKIYERVAVDVIIAGEVAMPALTYQSKISFPGRKPSPRYMNLLLNGAREHGLPEDYVRSLLAIELGRDERAGEKSVKANDT